MPVDPSETTNVWQAFPDPARFAALLNDMEGGRTNKFILQNNNPGNLKDASGNFRKFASWEEGQQALLDEMADWQSRFPNMSIAEFNRRYAPDRSSGGDNPEGTEAGRNRRMLSAMTGVPSARRSQPGPMSISEFANQVRFAFPQYIGVPDEVVVGQALRVRPDLITRLTAAPPTRFPQPAMGQELTPGEQIEKFGSIGGGALGNVLLGATKRSARELLTGGPGEGGQGTVPGILGSRPYEPPPEDPQEKAWAQQFEARHPTLSNLGGAFIGGLPGAKPVARGIQQATTPTGTAQQVGSWIPDVVAGAQLLRELPGVARGAYRVAQGVRWNPFMWPFQTALRSLAEGVAPETFRTTLQRVAGAGPGSVDMEVQAIQDANLKVLGQHETNVAEKTRLYDEAVQKYVNEKVPEVKRENLKELRQAHQEHAEAQRASSAANHEAARIQRDQQSIATRTQAYVKRGMDNVYRTYRAGQGDFDYRWADLREKIRTRVGGPREIGGRPNPRYGGLNSELIHGVIERETLGLAGSPENVQAFKQLTNFMTAEGGEVVLPAERAARAAQRAEQGGGPALRDIQWHEGLRYHNVIDRAIRSPSTAGAVRNALQTVQAEAIEPELARVAGLARVDRIYTQLNRDYSQWLTDWSDPGAVSTGASPLRDAVERKDPLTFLQDVTKGLGEDVKGPGHRMVQDFAKYRKYGADPELLTGIQNLTQQAKDLKMVKIPEPPGMFKPPTPKPLPTPPGFPDIKAPKFEIPRPEKFREQRLQQWANRPFTSREINMVRGELPRTVRAWLSDPAFRARVAAHPNAPEWREVPFSVKRFLREELWRSSKTPP